MMSTTATSLSRLLIEERSALLRLASGIVGSMAAAEDVAQALWLRIQKIEDDPPILNKRAYLYRLTSNLAIDQVRARRREAVVFDEGEAPAEIASTTPSAETRLLDQERLRRLERAVRALSPKCREVFVLVRLEEMAIPDVANRLNITDDMVRKHLRHALRACHTACYVPDEV